MGDKKKIFVIAIAIIITILISYLSYTNKKQLETGSKNNDWLNENVEIVKDSSLGKNIYKIYKNNDISIFNLKYQKVITEKIKKLAENTPNDFLVIYNPYGTNPLSVNIVFKEKNFKEIKYEITVPNIKSFSQKIHLKEDKSMYQLIGLYPGESNRIKITAINDSKSQVFDFKIDLSDLEINANKKLKVEKGISDSTLDKGLFAIFSNEDYSKNYITLYDNDGIIRSAISLKESMFNKLVFNNNDMFFSISNTEIVRLNNTGEITNIYKTGKYHIEEYYQFYNNDLYVLATDIKKDTLKTSIIKINIETNEVKEVLSLDELFIDYMLLCNKTDNEKLNYLDINSFVIIDDNLYLSSKETSSIIKIENIFNQPKIAYIISNDLFWKDTDYKELVLKQKEDFKIHAGQSAINIDKTIDDGIYYIMFFNNNYGNCSTRDFDYSNIDITNTNLYQGDNSYYYIYKINENDNSFELVDSLSLDYSGIDSNVLKLSNSNILISNSLKREFYEYDKDNKLIQKYFININKDFIYKVEKYSFNNYWFII